MYMVSAKILGSTNVFNEDNICLLELKIIILGWFPEDPDTDDAETSALHKRNELFFKISCKVILNCNDISQYHCFTVFKSMQPC